MSRMFLLNIIALKKVSVVGFHFNHLGKVPRYSIYYYRNSIHYFLPICPQQSKVTEVK